MTAVYCCDINLGSIFVLEALIAKQRINRQIRAREVQLIDADGDNRGVIPIQEALQIADDAGLDLIEVSPNSDPPVCRIADYGKILYKAKKKKTQSHSANTLKEISVSMKISEHDLQTKLKKAREFIEKGHKLRINLILRGREKAYANTKGAERLKDVATRLADVASLEQLNTGLVGNRLSAILSPAKQSAKD